MSEEKDTPHSPIDCMAKTISILPPEKQLLILDAWEEAFGMELDGVELRAKLINAVKAQK